MNILSRDIFSFVQTEEVNYGLPIEIGGWEWSMKEHIKTSFFYKNGRLLTGNSDDKPIKNIVLPIRNLQDRAEGFDIKDIILFINDRYNYYKSFLVKKFHEKWARENDLDTFIDEMVETEGDYGGVLIKNVNKVRPDVVPWQSIIFCDQTDILSGPIGIKHFYSPDQLMDMADLGWGDESNGANVSLEDLIVLAQNEKNFDKMGGQTAKTPGKYIEIYEVHGMFPELWIKGDSEKYVRQLHIIAFYNKENGEKQGLTLFKGKEKELPFKFKKRSLLYGRALGMGGIEELFEDQVWTNYGMMRKKDMLDSASKMIFKTTDSAIVARHPNGLKDLDNLEIIELAENTDIGQIDTYPRTMALFDKWDAELEIHARTTGAAQEAISGDKPSAGTPFKSMELQSAESHSLHDYRKGKFATFLGEIYRDWILPYIAKEITKGQEFLATLDLDELQYIADNLVICKANDFIKEKILNGEQIDPAEVDMVKQQTREQFMKGGNKKFIEILAMELKDVPIDVEVNIAGKQKYLAQIVDKIVNMVRQIIAAPQIMQIPGMAKLFNQIIESSGLNPVDFSSFSVQPPQQIQQPQQQMPQVAPAITQ